MKTQREKFEDWLRDDCECDDFRKTDEYYLCAHVQYDWSLWQAAIESVVVTLPDSHNDWLDKQLVEYALEQAGIKYD